MSEYAHFALTVAYDGSNFFGSQLQPNLRTVQGDLESVLQKLLKTPIRIKMSSRTDSGVHARGQVCTFKTADWSDERTLFNALNDHLADDIRVRKVVKLGDDSFNPRGDAIWREYTYTLNLGSTRPALERNFQLHIRAKLDLQKIDHCLAKIIGSKDFGAFCGPAVGDGKTTVRKFLYAKATHESDTLVFRLRANAFLHQQIRRMVSAFVSVGKGSTSTDRFEGLLEAGVKRGEWSDVYPPHPLVLERIAFPTKYGV